MIIQKSLCVHFWAKYNIEKGSPLCITRKVDFLFISALNGIIISNESILEGLIKYPGNKHCCATQNKYPPRNTGRRALKFSNRDDEVMVRAMSVGTAKRMSAEIYNQPRHKAFAPFVRFLRRGSQSSSSIQFVFRVAEPREICRWMLHARRHCQSTCISRYYSRRPATYNQFAIII